MSFFKRLFGGLIGGGGAPAGDDAGRNAYWLYVRCSACGEVIRVRVSREHDLSGEFEGESDAPTSYHLTKEVVGQKCFRRIHVEMSFDASKRPTDQQITGGTFVTREEFEAARDTPAATPAG